MNRRDVLCSLGGAAALSWPLRALAAADAPPAAKTVDAVDRRLGYTLRDPYRWMEDPRDPDWAPWMRAQGEYARRALDALPEHDALLRRIGELTGDLPVATRLQRAGTVTFLEFRPSGANVPKLYVVERPGAAQRLLIDPEAMTGAGGAHMSLDWWRASDDGALVVYGLSEAGSEESVARVMRVADRGHFPETIDRARFASPQWLPDGSAFFYTRGREGAVRGAPDYLLNRVAWLHKVGTDPRDDVRIAAGGDTIDGYTLLPIDFPFVVVTPGSDMALLLPYGGVRRENGLYVAPLAEAVTGRARWRTVARLADQITSFALRGRDIYLVSERDAPLGRILRVDAAAPDLGRAAAVVPEAATPIETTDAGLVAARDGIYFARQNGGPMTLHRLAPDGAVSDIAMPYDAGVYALFGSTDQDGVDVRLSGWVEPLAIYRYLPGGRLTDTGLSPRPRFSTAAYESVRLIATARDGTKVPVSIIAKRGLRRDGTAPALGQCYSSYGISASPVFSPRSIAFLERGGVLFEVHARGGGEYGAPWWRAGQKASKANTWRDFIDGCAAVVKAGWTAPTRLTIMGTSAGGIAVGNALVERPELFAGAIDNVGWTNTSRAGVEQNSAPNFPEFGDPSNEAEYRGLVAMDAYQKIRDGVRYPAVLAMTGISDPRVAPWHPAKFAARLQRASTGGPVLLRVDFDAGHGVGSTRQQTDAQWADVFAFAYSRGKVGG
ncbi:prolyl oligopeptidase family serine peptidase [Sphingomonas sp. BK580]|uniref:prolyl oligopeptidase family serine peptidase n=1 Tax=Sphingomonas sp. BK580 TaxID=2586972 RepID=UPI001612DAA8|nr:prolyl oligopeptidase family serine peptidase [Sphingomonas sp. BK580]MBB3694326.1 prolyl oligopeptidase [Sphingomonas sp. BK580]